MDFRRDKEVLQSEDTGKGSGEGVCEQRRLLLFKNTVLSAAAAKRIITALMITDFLFNKAILKCLSLYCQQLQFQYGPPGGSTSPGLVPPAEFSNVHLFSVLVFICFTLNQLWLL